MKGDVTTCPAMVTIPCLINRSASRRLILNLFDWAKSLESLVGSLSVMTAGVVVKYLEQKVNSLFFCAIVVLGVIDWHAKVVTAGVMNCCCATRTMKVAERGKALANNMVFIRNQCIWLPVCREHHPTQGMIYRLPGTILVPPEPGSSKWGSIRWCLFFSAYMLCRYGIWILYFIFLWSCQHCQGRILFSYQYICILRLI